MDPLAKLILNGLKCPVCHGQIDLLSSIIMKAFNYGCVYDPWHYHLWFDQYRPVLNIDYEQVIVYEGRHKYRIHQNNNKDTTDIFVYDVDQEGNLVDEAEPPKTFAYDKKLFDFSKTTREKLINRVKTILVFQ